MIRSWHGGSNETTRVTDRQVWPWPQQAAQPGTVHILRIGAANPRAVRNAAYRWGKRHACTFEYRELGGTILIRWAAQSP